MGDQKARANAVAELMTDRVLQSLKAIKPKNSFSDYLLFIVGFLVVIAAISWGGYNCYSFSRSVSELTPTPDVAIANIDKIGILLGAQSVETTMIFGLYAIGLALIGFGFAWLADRSNTRTTTAIITATTVIGQTITEVILEELNNLGQRPEADSHVRKRVRKK